MRLQKNNNKKTVKLCCEGAWLLVATQLSVSLHACTIDQPISQQHDILIFLFWGHVLYGSVKQYKKQNKKTSNAISLM